MPSSSSRSCRSRGSIALARSSVFSAGRPHHETRNAPERPHRVGVEAPHQAGAVLDDVPRVDRARATLVGQEVAEPGEVLDAVPVGVDDGMIEPGSDLRRGEGHVAP